MLRYELNQKLSFINDFLTFSREDKVDITERLEELIRDPLPNGGNKKKLTNLKLNGYPLYRFRFRNIRILYILTDNVIYLIAVRFRKVVYDKNYRKIVIFSTNQSPIIITDTLPNSIEVENDNEEEDDNEYQILEGNPDDLPPLNEPTLLLPFKLTKEFLSRILIPETYHHVILACETEDDLLNLNITEIYHQRLINCIYPSNLKKIESDPILQLHQISDLLKYGDGELSGFLLALDDEQKKCVSFALDGPTLVKGGAGTGKSTVALYRVKELLQKDPNATILFATYTKTLTKLSRQLLEKILEPEKLSKVSILTCDQVIRDVVSTTRSLKPIAQDNKVDKLVEKSIQKVFLQCEDNIQNKMTRIALEKLGNHYLREEFEWVIEANQLTLEEYLVYPRQGRHLKLSERKRFLIYQCFKTFKELLVEANDNEFFFRLRTEAYELVKTSPKNLEKYDYVLIDETQDISFTTLYTLIELCKNPKGIFLAADLKQSIYSNSPWSDIHPKLQLRGRTRILQKNYRSTKQIAEASFEILASSELDRQSSEFTHEGLKPFILNMPQNMPEAPQMIAFIHYIMKSFLIKASAFALLVPNQKIGEFYVEELLKNGQQAVFMNSENLDISINQIKVMTFHSAKGLEFPVVIMAGFTNGTYPTPTSYNDSDLYTEKMMAERRLLYVAMTRAMKVLLIIKPFGCTHEALNHLTLNQWNIQDVKNN